MSGLIVSIGDGLGSWSDPFREAGYKVEVIDPLVNGRYIQDESGEPYRGRVDGVLVALPCTVHANSGVRWKFSHHRSLFKVRQSLQLWIEAARFIGECEPRWWAFENPVGDLPQYVGPYSYTFNPNEYGDPYTKRTCIWSNLPKPPTSPVEASEGSMLWRLPPGPDRWRERSKTPAGFARAFAEQAMTMLTLPLFEPAPVIERPVQHLAWVSPGLWGGQWRAVCCCGERSPSWTGSARAHAWREKHEAGR